MALTLRERIGLAVASAVSGRRIEVRGVDPTEAGWRGTGGRWFGGISRRNVELWLQNFGEHSRLQSVVRRVSKDTAAVRWQVFRELEGEVGPDGNPKRVPLRKHPLAQLWNRPHPTFSGTKLRYLLQVHLELAGEAFLLIRRRQGSLVPEELWPIPPHWVTELPREGQPWWTVNVGGSPERIPVGEILWLQDPDPLNPYGRGLGPASAVDDEVSQSEWANKWNNAFFRNAARPDFVIGIPGINPQDYDRLRTQWEERYQGFFNAFRPAFLSADAKVHMLTRGHQDMDFIEMLRFLRDAIFQNWQVPPEIMGVVENSNRATAEAAMFVYAQNVLVPRLEFLKDEMAMWLTPLFGGDADLVLDYQNPVKETQEFRLKQASEGFKLGAIKRNEWRAANGFDPDPEHGDVYLTPLNILQQGPGAEKEEGPGAPEEDPNAHP